MIYYFWSLLPPLPLLFETQKTTRQNTNLTPKKPEHEQKGALDIQSEYILFYI
jgi:hypothetical protein